MLATMAGSRAIFELGDNALTATKSRGELDTKEKTCCVMRIALLRRCTRRDSIPFGTMHPSRLHAPVQNVKNGGKTVTYINLQSKVK